MSAQPKTCQWEGCNSPSVVGINGSWLCLPHFEQGLKGVRQKMDDLAQALTVPQAKPKPKRSRHD